MQFGRENRFDNNIPVHFFFFFNSQNFILLSYFFTYIMIYCTIDP